MKAGNGSPVVQLLSTLCLVLLIVVLAEIAWLQFFAGAWGREVPQDPLGLDRELETVEPLPPRSAFDETVARSLFSWDRKPVMVERTDIDDEPLRSRWMLVGVVNDGATSRGVFYSLVGDHYLTLERGMYLERWQIADILPESVILERNGNEQGLQLEVIEQESEDTAAAPRKKTPSTGASETPPEKEAP